MHLTVPQLRTLAKVMKTREIMAVRFYQGDGKLMIAFPAKRGGLFYRWISQEGKFVR